MNDALEKIMNAFHIAAFGVIPVPLRETWLSCRAVQRVPENAKTLIPCLFPYNIGDIERNISRYAIVPDYHSVVLSVLEKVCKVLSDQFSGKFIPFADNSPFPEVSCAAAAGLGVIGENQLLINKMYGSYVFIGEIVTDIAFETAVYPKRSCLQCSACARACHGNAIENKEIVTARCLSHISQKKGDLSDEETVLLQRGSYVWGCDVCQDVCPMNKDIQKTGITAFYENVFPVLTLENIPEKIREYAFGFRGRTVLERNLHVIQK